MFRILPLFFIVCSLFFCSAIKSQTVKIKGRLYAKEDCKVISGGIISLTPDNKTTLTNQKGEYYFICNPGTKRVSSQILGYKKSIKQFNVNSDTIIDIYLEILPITLNEIMVTGDSIKNLISTLGGNIFLTPNAIKDMPKLFSEPDLFKSLQLLPGVIAGKNGSSDIYVRGGEMGQNIIIANGCYFFLPGHLLGTISPYDLYFLESAELYKDYFPAKLGGGASSVLSLEFKRPQIDSLRAQFRVGLLSSGATIEIPIKKTNWLLAAGLRRGNYSFYAPLLKKIVSADKDEFLPPNNYSFYDGFLQLSHNSHKWGKINYLFFGNLDKGKNKSIVNSQSGDTLFRYEDRILQGWNNLIHALQWSLPDNEKIKWELNLNYNRISIGRDISMLSEKSLSKSEIFAIQRSSYSFYPTINNIGSTIQLNGEDGKLIYNAGVSTRFRYFTTGIVSSYSNSDTLIKNRFGEDYRLIETAAFLSSTIFLTKNLQINSGIRLSEGLIKDENFFVVEPRLRLILNQNRSISPHINYVRLSQFDHSIEGSNSGLRTLLWLPVFKDFGPEISDILSAGLQGKFNEAFTWSIDGYFKKIFGMIDFKPGASFIFDTSFDDMIEKTDIRACGVETGILKLKGALTGSASYTYSRSKREWISPEGRIWIPSNADRPHNVSLTIKYHISDKKSFGLNWIYQSGAPATIYMHNTSYGEWFESKNNIRYFDYHRLDLSFRQIIHQRKFSILIDADISNVYNRKNTSYFKEVHNKSSGLYYFKNISLFPIMPSLSVTLKY